MVERGMICLLCNLAASWKPMAHRRWKIFLADDIRWALDSPHSLPQMKPVLIWERRYDEYENRTAGYIGGYPMLLQQIETTDKPASRVMYKSPIYL